MYQSDLEVGNEILIYNRIDNQKSKANEEYQAKMKRRYQCFNQIANNRDKKRKLKFNLKTPLIKPKVHRNIQI